LNLETDAIDHPRGHDYHSFTSYTNVAFEKSPDNKPIVPILCHEMIDRHASESRTPDLDGLIEEP